MAINLKDCSSSITVEMSPQHLLLTQAPIIVYYLVFFKENQNTPIPSEHPPVMGGKMLKRLGGVKGCKYKKNSSWHLNRFPDADNIGSTV